MKMAQTKITFYQLAEAACTKLLHQGLVFMREFFCCQFKHLMCARPTLTVGARSLSAPSRGNDARGEFNAEISTKGTEDQQGETCLW
jgi:hypothetical protein